MLNVKDLKRTMETYRFLVTGTGDSGELRLVSGSWVRKVSWKSSSIEMYGANMSRSMASMSLNIME